MVETEVFGPDVFGQIDLGDALQVLLHLGVVVEEPST